MYSVYMASPVVIRSGSHTMKMKYLWHWDRGVFLDFGSSLFNILELWGFPYMCTYKLTDLNNSKVYACKLCDGVLLFLLSNLRILNTKVCDIWTLCCPSQWNTNTIECRCSNHSHPASSSKKCTFRLGWSIGWWNNHEPFWCKKKKNRK